MQTQTIESSREIQEAVMAFPRLVVRGGGTKPGLNPVDDAAALLDLRGLRGILEYVPGEYTFTALAGTPLAEVRDALSDHGQYMPFDPPLVDAGGTLGGVVAAGLSGAGRQRYGGVRDFLLGVRFVDGEGRLVRGGGKVVKNAAGFDLPKLMVGSLGQLGVLAELSFKVFPRPPAFASLTVALSDIDAGLVALDRLAHAPLDLDAVDLQVDDQVVLSLRIGGLAATLPQRLDRLQRIVGAGRVDRDADDAAIWREAGEFVWAQGRTLVKIPSAPPRLRELDALLAGLGARRRYSAGGHVAWAALTDGLPVLGVQLAALDLGGLVVRGAPTGLTPLIGSVHGGPFFSRVKQALDPHRRFADFIRQ